MKLSNLGLTTKGTGIMPPVEKTTTFPEVELNSKSIPELKKYAKQGMKCDLQFKGEIIATRAARDWDMKSHELSKGDVIATVRLTQGTIDEAEKPKTLNEASHMILQEESDKD